MKWMHRASQRARARDRASRGCCVALSHACTTRDALSASRNAANCIALSWQRPRSSWLPPVRSFLTRFLPNSDLVCIGAAAHRVCLHDRSAVVLAQVSGSMCVAGRRIKDMLAAAHGMSSSTSSWPRPTPAYAEPILCVSTIGSTYMASLSALATIGRTTWPRLYFSRSMCDVARRSVCDMWGG